MDVQSLLLILGALAVIGGCVFMLMEHRSRTLRTRVIDIPGTLRFEAHTFSVEVKVPTKQIQVHANKGRLTRTPLQSGPEEVQEGPLDATLPAPGLTMVVAPADNALRNGQNKRPTVGLSSITIPTSCQAGSSLSWTSRPFQRLLPKVLKPSQTECTSGRTSWSAA